MPRRYEADEKEYGEIYAWPWSDDDGSDMGHYIHTLRMKLTTDTETRRSEEVSISPPLGEGARKQWFRDVRSALDELEDELAQNREEQQREESRKKCELAEEDEEDAQDEEDDEDEVPEASQASEDDVWAEAL